MTDVLPAEPTETVAVRKLRAALKRERERGITQEALEAELSLASGYLSHLLAGNFAPGRDRAARIEKRLGVKTGDWSRRPAARLAHKRRGAKLSTRSAGASR
jgi:transcriptional regulator with XRE-family HTH domain